MHDHDRGLVFDLETLLARRRALKLFAGVGLAAVAGCAADDGTAGPAAKESTSTTPAPSTTGTTPAQQSSCEEVPEETAGPFPGDGSNGPNVLTESGIVRSDITKSFGSASGVAAGVPLTVKLTVQDTNCKARSGAAVYIWHCDQAGRYSLYSDGATDQNYLRGVQAADSSGTVTFKTVFPGAYEGRWPHIHFEVYQSLAEATAAGKISATSQIALPEDACRAAYASDGYDGSTQNLEQTSLTRDSVFRDDGGSRQLATMTGNAQSGYVAALTIAV